MKMDGTSIWLKATLLYPGDNVYWINYGNTHAQITVVGDWKIVCMGPSLMYFAFCRKGSLQGDMNQDCDQQTAQRRHRYTVTKVFS